MNTGLATSDIPKELVERLQHRDPSAFDEFLELLGPRLLNFGMRMCQDREDARDVLQETMLKTFESVGDLRHPDAFRTWLYRIAANACLMKRRHSRFLKEEVSLEEVLPDPEQIKGGPAWGGLPDQALLDGELKKQVREAIYSLPPLYRSVLVLRDMEGLDTDEVAQVLGLNKDVVKMRLHRARAKVRQALDKILNG